MAKYRKKPVIIDATQWFKNGDYPQDNAFHPFREVVRYYRTSEFGKKCKKCGDIMHNHGWIGTLEGGHIVCPADWIIRGIKDEFYPCKPNIFEQTYEAVD